MAEALSSLRELVALAAGAPPRVPLPPRATWLWDPAVVLLRIGFKVFSQVAVTGAQYVPAEGPLIVACNHFSFLDPPLLAAAFPRPGHVLAKQELLDTPIGGLIGALGIIPVRRGEADVDALAMALDALRRGRVVAIFPEGTRGHGVATGLKPGHRGVALMAHLSGAPVVPVGISGTEGVRQLGDVVRSVATRPHFQVSIGPPLHFSRQQRIPPSAELTATTKAIMAAIAARLPPQHRGVYTERVSPPGP